VFSSAALYVLQYYFLMDRLVGIPIRQLWDEIRPALACLLPLFAAGVGAVRLFASLGAPAPVRTLAGGAAALIAYGLCMRLAHPETFDDLALLFRRVLGR